MRIIMVCEFYEQGLGFQENLLVKYYRKAGHDVTVITSTFENVFEYYGNRYDPTRQQWETRDYGARIVRVPFLFNWLHKIRPYRPIMRILEEERPDLIYVHDVVPNIVECAHYVRRNPGTRMIFDFHADASNSGKNWLSRWVLHGIIRRALLSYARPQIDRIFPIVPQGADFLNRYYGVPYSDMEILPLGADTDECADARKRAASLELRDALGISSESFVVFTGGKLNSAKRTELLLEAALHLNHPDLVVMVVGKGDLYSHEYAATLAEDYAHPNIRFLGWMPQDKLLDLLAISDVAIFPASQSVLWQLAIAMHLPLIVGDTGGQAPHYLNKYGNILIIEPERLSAAAIADALLRCKQSPNLLTNMRNGARKVAAESLDYYVITETTLGNRRRSNNQ